MTIGAVIIVNENPDIDYLRMAELNVYLIQKHWKIPALIWYSDNKTQKRSMLINGQRKTTIWKNFGRYEPFLEPPFDHTIVVDADYVVQGDELTKMFHYENWMFGSSIDLNGKVLSPTFGTYQDPMLWATVCSVDKHIAEHWRDIEFNWEFFTGLFNIPPSTFRNDLALSIALQTTQKERAIVPWRMTTVSQGTELIDYDQGEWTFQDLRGKQIKVKDIDLHFMDKAWLTDELEKKLYA